MNDQVLDIETTLRNASLPSLVELLRAQQGSKYDVVATADRLHMYGGVLHLLGDDAEITLDGVTPADGRYACTDGFDGDVADKLGIPVKYLRKMRVEGVRLPLEDAGISPDHDPNEAPMLLDANVNTWLDQEPGRKMLVRTFRNTGGIGIARALLSDHYAPIDNLDVLTAALGGVRDAGVEIKIQGANLSERKMSVQVYAPEIAALAPILLANYRSPFTDGHGQTGNVNRAHDAGLAYDVGAGPVCFAGFEIGNSETGGAAFTITPRIVIPICSNGMKITRDVIRSTHLGGKLDMGVIEWSGDTMRKSLELVQAKTADAVRTFLNVDYMRGVIEAAERKAGVAVVDAQGTIEKVATKFGFTEAEQASVLDCFISSGQLTAGGVMQVVTAAAQTVTSPDRAGDLEDVALDVLDFVTAGR